MLLNIDFINFSQSVIKISTFFYTITFFAFFDLQYLNFYLNFLKILYYKVFNLTKDQMNGVGSYF